MNEADIVNARKTMQAVACACLTCASLTVCAMHAAEDDDMLSGSYGPYILRPLPFPSASFHPSGPADRAASPGIVDSALALCVPDLYCSLAPNPASRDDAAFQLARIRWRPHAERLR